jgi:hypothetical protein
MRNTSSIFTTLLLLLLVLTAQSAQAQCAVSEGTFNVPERVREVDTGMNVNVGDTVIFNASGSIWAGVWFTGENGPAGWDNLHHAPTNGFYPLPGGRIYSLVGRINRGPAFYIGEGREMTMREAGRLSLLINDNVVNNGSGSFSCRVQVYRPSPRISIDRTISIPENTRGDISTGITIFPGDRILFQGSGRIWAGVWLTGENGPEGWDRINNDRSYPLPDARIYSLIGNLSGRYFYVGSSGERVHSGTPSVLLLRINDNVPGNGNGQFTCRIRVERAGAPLPSSFNGTATLRLNHPNTPNAFNRPVPMSVEFSRDRCNLRIVRFPPIVQTFDTGTVLGTNTTTITMIRGGTGSFNQTTGHIDLPVTLLFSHSIGAAGPSTCDLRLRTDVSGGQPLSMGRARLVGSCRCAGGFLNNTNGDFTVEGSFSPSP